MHQGKSFWEKKKHMWKLQKVRRVKTSQSRWFRQSGEGPPSKTKLPGWYTTLTLHFAQIWLCHLPSGVLRASTSASTLFCLWWNNPDVSWIVWELWTWPQYSRLCLVSFYLILSRWKGVIRNRCLYLHGFYGLDVTDLGRVSSEWGAMGGTPLRLHFAKLCV